MRRRLLALLLALPVLLALPMPAPAAAEDSMRLVVERVYQHSGKRVALRHQKVRIRGLVSRYAPGEVVSLSVRQGRRAFVSVRRTIQPAGTGGQFTVEFKAHRGGRLRAYATHGATPGLGAMAASSRSVFVIAPTAGPGATGLRVEFLQHRLRDLRFIVRLTGRWDAATARAVLAYRKVSRMRRTMTANKGVFTRLARRLGGFRVRYPRHGKHVEADITRQVLVLIDRRGRVFRVLHMSSGKSSTPTVLGSFRFYSKQPGFNSHGMLHSNYFHGGYAVHGFNPVPTFPASHGCLRIPNPNARFVNRWIKLGDRIDVYRS